MSTNGIPSPAMPASRRPISSIAQTAEVSHTPTTAVIIEQPAPDTQAHTTAAAPQQLEDIKTPEAQPIPATPPVQTERQSRTRRAGSAREQPTPRDNLAKVSRIQKPILLKLDEDLKERMVNTMEWTGPRTGLRNQQVFIRRAIADLCERLENEHNAGQPFPLIVEALEA